VHWPVFRVAVAERSMEPALRPGDWLLVRRTRRVRPGQIVLARHPGRPDMLIVKRAARRVNGGWWLESDNPEAGAVDSRRFGPVPGSLIEGRVLVRYWPRRTLYFLAERAVLPAPAIRKTRWSRREDGTTGLASPPGSPHQCRGVSGASAIRELCSSTSFSTSWRGSATATAQ
jgi:nickel-type superoxide dismutase maturation protease